MPSPAHSLMHHQLTTNYKVWTWKHIPNTLNIALFFINLYWEIMTKLTDDAWVSGPDLAPQKILLSQKFRHLMRCKKYFEKIFLSCLVSEIQLFVYIFGQISKWHELNADAWVSGPVRAPQKILLSQKFRHLMRWRNMQKKFFYLA